MADLGTGKRILVVDDDPIVVRAVTTALARDGFQVMVAENGAAGLETFLAHADAIDLVLTDVMMPSLNGVEMAQRIREAQPDARIVLMTGYSDAVIDTLKGTAYPMMRKPFLADDLVRVVRVNIAPPAATA
jgi:DNA-binding NtrC family response regulator